MGKESIDNYSMYGEREGLVNRKVGKGSIDNYSMYGEREGLVK